MTTYVFRIWLQPHPSPRFEPDEEVWHDLEIDGLYTLVTFHEAIFQAFNCWESHAYGFITRDDNDIALQSYVHPMFYGGGPSWRTMNDEEIDRFIEQAVSDDAFEEAKGRFRELQSDPPMEGNAAETTIDELDPEDLGALSYTLDMGDSRERYVELQDMRMGSMDGDPVVVDEQGTAPSQYPDLDE